MLTIDGSQGEGGGQILRTALSLSLCLKTPFRMISIRAGRQQPGLRLQHLAAVRAAAQIGSAEVTGDQIGSTELTFVPRGMLAGEFHFDVGSAGSTSLVLQTVLPALAMADRPSRLVIGGGTHNPLAPPFEFLQLAFLPLINRMGPVCSITLERPGFYPAGGGRINVSINPAEVLKPLVLETRGAVRHMRAIASVANLPRHIGQRELGVIQMQLHLGRECLTVRELGSTPGPGNAVVVIVECEQVTEVFSAIGERGIRAEDVALRVVGEVQRYLSAGAPVGEHLGDQLLLPLALAGGGSYVTLRPDSHLESNITVVKKFLNINIHCESLAGDLWLVRLC
ncbi:MAG: RNA 3'-terminal phosphate cyclase [Pseudomonadota bacterium]